MDISYMNVQQKLAHWNLKELQKMSNQKMEILFLLLVQPVGLVLGL